MQTQFILPARAELVAFIDQTEADTWLRSNPLALTVAKVKGSLSHPGQIRLVVAHCSTKAEKDKAAQQLATLHAHARRAYFRAAQANARLRKAI